MELRDLRAWPITPVKLERAAFGQNNDTFFVSAREGEFVVRVYRNTADPSRVRNEHHLLGLLAMQELPFQVPAPVHTGSADTLAILESPEGPRLATLFARIPGEPATIELSNARVAGRALAQLDLALGRVDFPLRTTPTIRDVHPLVADPMAALTEVDLGARESQVRELFEQVELAHGALAGSLPRQIIHADFAYVNVLVKDGAVTGMLDFEFAGPGVRAGDLAIAMYLTIVRGEAPLRWQLLEALAAGYRRALVLDPLEVAAIPALMRQRSAFGIIHWIGRYRQGLSSRDEIFGRIERSAMLIDWLDANAARLATIVSGERV